MDAVRLKNIITANGGPEKIILFTFGDGTRATAREDHTLDLDNDIDESTQTITFRGRSDVKRRRYNDVFMIESIIGITFAVDDEEGKEFDVMSVRG